MGAAIWRREYLQEQQFLFFTMNAPDFHHDSPTLCIDLRLPGAQATIVHPIELQDGQRLSENF